MNKLDKINLSLLLEYFKLHPIDATRRLELLDFNESLEVVRTLPEENLGKIFKNLSPEFGYRVLNSLDDERKTFLLKSLEVDILARIIGFAENDSDLESFYHALSPDRAAEVKEILVYDPKLVGYWMDKNILTLSANYTVDQAAQIIRRKELDELHILYLVDDEMKLVGAVEIHLLLTKSPDLSLKSLAQPVRFTLHAMDSKEEALDILQKNHLQSIPILDASDRLYGVLQGKGLLEAVREEAASDMQTMVGVSKDERALSPFTFAVKKRLPWLQINLLTAFMASAVVAAFEGLIAQYTALAILLPIAAGQSGNAGAQALAVTMRGLTLREIRVSQWLLVIKKELLSGIFNGIGVAITCSICIYFWSKNAGLALIMGIAMITSMTIACMAGAWVPIMLKKFGLDPAQSSSIVLTTITDIAGFLSFLGIATLLAGLM